MRDIDTTDDKFKRVEEVRKRQMRQWKTIPEDRRPTWEQFKRGLQPHAGSPLANFQARLENL
jgi:hypothetical protein